MKKCKIYNVLPCPNCYGSNLELVHYKLTSKHFRRHWVRCNICGSVGPDKLTRDGAVKAYNREAYQELLKRRAEADGTDKEKP